MKILLLAVVATLAACASRADRYSENQQAVAQFRQTRPYLSNGLSDPDYQIEGKDVTLAQVQRFIGQFNETFLEAKSWEPTIRPTWKGCCGMTKRCSNIGPTRRRLS